MKHCKPVFKNVALTSNTAAYLFMFPAGVVAFTINCRDATDIKIGTTEADVIAGTGDCKTIKSGQVFDIRDIDLQANFSLFISCATNSKVAEIVYWQRIT